MITIKFESSRVNDWETFHAYSKELFGFPDFYGNNMNAWVDCLTYLRDGDGMSRIHLKNDELLHLEVTETKDFRSRVPEIFEALIDCTAFVNCRNYPPVLAIVFTDIRF